MSNESTKKARKFTRGFEGMRSHYDFAGGVRGKHARAYAEGVTRVTLAPDVTAYFPDSDSVNEALRALVRIAAARKPRPARRRAS